MALNGVGKTGSHPGHVDSASGPQPEKDERAPDPKFPRSPVKPAPAVPIDGKGRALGHPLFGT